MILPLHREWLRGAMVCGCGRCDWLSFLCWVIVWAGCLCFWVLGPGLEVPTAERAASGRAVGFLGLWVFVSMEGALCAWRAQITPGCSSLVTPWLP